MRKFTKLVESLEGEKFFKVKCELDFTIKASNQGEASYIADEELSSLKNQSGYAIKEISETTEDEFNVLSESYGIGFQDQEEELTDEEKVLKSWDVEFGDRMPTSTEKLEFYHQLRSAGIDGILILDILKRKL